MALNSQLRKQVQDYLIRSGSLDSNSSLRGLFVDARISPWRNNVPEAENRASRANQMIANFDSMNGQHNILALILQVIADRTSYGDSQKSLGEELARQVQAGSTESKRSEYERELAQLEDHYKRGWTQEPYYSKRKAQLLDLIAQFDAPSELPKDDSLPSGQMIDLWKEEFAASAKALVEARAVYEVYAQYGVDSSGVMRTIGKATGRCAELATKLREHDPFSISL